MDQTTQDIDDSMTLERHAFLMDNPKEELTPEEFDAGWHFCTSEWDGLLIHRTDHEAQFCKCEWKNPADQAKMAFVGRLV